MDSAKKAAKLKQSFTRFSRHYNLFIRQQHASTITVQQCYILEALAGKPLTMTELADEIGIHQSTLTRIVAKLEKLDLVIRTRNPSNQRIVEVSSTDSGEKIHQKLNQHSLEMIERILRQIPKDRQEMIVETMAYLSELLDPKNPLLNGLLRSCCSPDDIRKEAAEASNRAQVNI